MMERTWFVGLLGSTLCDWQRSSCVGEVGLECCALDTEAFESGEHVVVAV